MGGRQKEGGVRKDKLGGDVNPTKIHQESCPIYEIAWTNRPIQVHNIWLATHMSLAANTTTLIALERGSGGDTGAVKTHFVEN